MKSKVILSAVLLVFLGASAVWAGDPWKKKPHTEWSMEEVMTVLHRSPWARVVRAVDRQSSRERAAGIEAAEIGRSTPSARDESAPHDLSYDPRASSVGHDGLVWRTGVAVRWLSSRTIREAMARYRLLNEAEEVNVPGLSVQLEYYTIGLLSPRLVPVAETVGKTASLKLLPSGKIVRPTQVERVKKDSFADILVHFPREVDGQPLFSVKDKKVEFSCDYGLTQAPTKVKAKFDLRKMVRDGKPDL